MSLPLKTTLALIAVGLMAGAAHAAPLPQAPQGASLVIAVVDNAGDSEASEMDKKADQSGGASGAPGAQAPNLGDGEASDMDKKADATSGASGGGSAQPSDEPMENKEYDRETNQ